MRNRVSFLLLWLLFSQICFGNMASPIMPGTLGSLAFASSQIDITHERIWVKPNKDFTTAEYVIDYYIKTDTAGKQIPLLFHAIGYEGKFVVLVDSIEVGVLEVPDEYTRGDGSPFKSFAGSFENTGNSGYNETVKIYWEEKSAIVYQLNELKYFEVNLTKGAHHIHIEYAARAQINRSGWIKKHSFIYSLSPARHWRSFGTLNVIVDATESGETLSTNLGIPTEGSFNKTATWSFDKIPADFFTIEHTPQASRLANMLISLTPFWIAVIIGILLALGHFAIIYYYQRNHPTKKYLWLVITGSMLVPLLTLLCYIWSFGVIDDCIGPEAGRYHGYRFLVIGFYPLLAPVYGLAIWFGGRLTRV